MALKSGLTLAGEPGTVLHAFPGMVSSLAAYGYNDIAVCALYRSDVVVSGLQFDGEKLGGSVPRILEGLLFMGAGGVVSNCTFSGFRAVGVTNAVTVAKAMICINWVNTGADPVHVTIAGNVFTNNQVAIHLGGDPLSAPEQLRLSTTIHGNTITGLGPSPGWNSGLLLAGGVGSEVTQNVFSDFAGTGDLGSAAVNGYDGLAQTHGRFVPLQPLYFDGNTFTNNGQHLLLVGANDSRVVNNQLLGAVPGAVASAGLGVSGTNVLVANNNFSDMPTGTLLVGTESWPAPWPTMPTAANPKLVANWFCNVPEPIRVNPLITVLQEQATETNCPFAPRFQSITRSSTGEILTLLRGWRGDSYVIETSTNLQHWAPVHTNPMTLPLFEFRDTNTPASPHRFYRAFKQE